jgi:hypothetical protein
MTTCTPIKPFRCWQYRKDSTEPVPEWVDAAYLLVAMDDDWFVALTDLDHAILCQWYTPAEFQERFRVEEGKE